ncbi:hypothetical protein E2C01_091575 [Portunus trituberculatus]|uniref:Uncharacterized protein n=1 Tax=Portunus trituberculatus TaxID=210409 RepID=A0A5B7JPF4_PORTR|nr:hypothetical protein [Portunus trituberculatus]
MHSSEELPEQETAVRGPCGGESSFLLRPEDDVSWARSATSRERARETTYSDDNGNERWLPWTGYLVPMQTNRSKKKARHDAESLSTTELRTPSLSIPAWTPNHPIPLRNRAYFFGKVPRGMDDIPAPFSVVRHKPTWRRDMRNFWN